MRRGVATLALLALWWSAAAPANAGGTPEPRREAASDAPDAARTPPREPEPMRTAPAAEPVDPRARLPAGDDAAEHWDLAARFASGHRLYVRFLITETGPGGRSAAASGHWVAPDGETQEFRNGRRAGRWQLSDDGGRIDIGSSLLVLGDGQRHFEVDNDKRGIKIRLDFPDDGSARTGPRRDDGYHVDLLNLATPARGELWLEGMPQARSLEGRVLLTHTWFPGPEDRHLQQRLDLATLAPGPRLFLSRVVPPEGRPWHWIVAGAEDGLRAVPEARLETRGASSDAYPIPDRVEMMGKTLDGSARLGPTRLVTDPLDALPSLLRMVYSFGLRPRHVWVDQTADVALKSPSGDAVLRIQGPGAAALFFTDALPPSQRQP